MFNQFFYKNLNQIKRIGTIVLLLSGLCVPLITHAHGKDGHTNTQEGEAKHGQAEQGATQHGDAHKAENSHNDMQHSVGHGHAHKLVDVSRWESVPAVSMEVEKDAHSGWNIRLKPHNFQFTPENVNKDNQIGEGHAHLYVDDKKVARVYSAWFHLPDLPAGKHSIKITLNANDHSTLAVVDNPIENITIIEQE